MQSHHTPRLAYKSALQHDANKELAGSLHDNMRSELCERSRLYLCDDAEDGGCGGGGQQQDVEAEEEECLVEEALEATDSGGVTFVPGCEG